MLADLVFGHLGSEAGQLILVARNKNDIFRSWDLGTISGFYFVFKFFS